MTLIKKPQTRSLDSLLKNNQFSIPDLQRNYEWSLDELKKFWNDCKDLVDEDRDEYFFGPMVFVEEDEDNRLQIIDGQQRLITASILVALARDICFKEKNNSAVSELQRLLFSKIDYQGKPISGSDILTLNDNNELYFNDFILSPEEPEAKLSAYRTANEYDKPMFSAYKELKKSIEEYGNGKILSKLLPSFLNKIMTRFIVIEIIVDSVESGHRVFETLNYRGRDLNISSLVKNYVLEHSKSSDLKTNLMKWKEITNNINTKTMDDFIKHHWIAYHGPVTPTSLFDKIKKNIDDHNKVNGFVSELVRDSKIYKQLRDPKKSYWYNDQEIVDYLEDLNDLKNDSAQPLLLVAKRVWNDKEKIRELVKTCSIIHFRAKSIGNKSPSEMIKTMYSVASGLRSKRENFTMEDVKKIFQTIDITPKNFETIFKENSFSGKEAMYVLRKIETKRNGDYSAKRASSKATLEHILPQTLSEEWARSFTPEKHKKCVGLIGNLTILHDLLNKKIQNDSFIEKKKEYLKQKDVKITLAVTKESHWTETEIRNRTDEFTNDALQIWVL